MQILAKTAIKEILRGVEKKAVIFEASLRINQVPTYEKALKKF